jgi:MoxR-like ATPase
MKTENAILYGDEPNAIPSDVLFYLFSAMDDRREIVLQNGEVVKAKKGFVIVCAMNEGAGYAGTALLNSAFRQRSVVIDMHYLPAKREAKVLVGRTGIDAATADKLTDMALRLRNGTIKTPIGTRALLACASLIKHDVDALTACECAITNQVPATNALERKAVSDIVAAYFGKGVK